MAGEVIVLAGMPCSGKTFYASKHYDPIEVASFDMMSGLLGLTETGDGDEAMSLLHTLVSARSRMGGRTAIDYTNLTLAERFTWMAVARRNNMRVTLKAFDIPLWLAKWRNNIRRTPLPTRQLEACFEKARVMLSHVESEDFDDVEKIGLPNQEVYPDCCHMCGDTLIFRDDPDNKRMGLSFFCDTCSIKFPVLPTERVSRLGIVAV